MSDQVTTMTVVNCRGHFRTAAIFEQFGIDFCRGRQDLADACRFATADPPTW